MSIAPGTRIGAYEVTSQLGEGGMGVVLRARDTKLLRDVALKVLPEHFAEDSDRLSRLQREAQLLASVNHPNIAQIYGLEQLGNTGCIIMELVEGETLSERLKNGPIPVDEAIDIAKQIADALAAAHERGIVHRDLKPANIKITPGGTVKVLDFGLAKALENRTIDTQLSAMPTKVSGSVAGMVVGTIGYMSPEQARGKEVDSRTDIWAFGSVLYEMLTARQAFEGETATDMIARIVSGQPDLTLLPAGVPKSVRLLMESTLQKNVQQRLQHIGDIRLFLDQNLFTPAGAAPETKPKNTRLVAAVFIAGLMVAAIPVAVYFRPAAAPSAPRMHFEIPLPGLLGAMSISPDGQHVAYIGQPPSTDRGIWIRPVGSDTVQKLSGTENANAIFVWSPDSRHLLFVAEGKMKKIDVLGGAPQVISDFSGNARGSAWSSAGVILFSTTPGNVLMRVSEGGGEPQALTKLDETRKEILHAGPVFLPDDNRFFYLIASSVADNSGIFVGSLDGMTPKRLMPMPASINGLAYMPPYFLYSNGQTVMARRFDADSLTLEGEPIPLTEGAQGGNFSVSSNGVFVYRKTSIAPPNRQLLWFDRNGKQLGKAGTDVNYGTVELSPKGDRAAVDIYTGNNNRDIWVVDIARGVPSRITFEGGNDWSPSWSRDGDRLTFASARSGANDIYQKSSSGVGADEKIYNSEKNEIPVHWSPDGRYIVFSRPQPKGGNDTWIFDSVEKKELPFVESPFDKVHARVSPNGRWLAYSTNDSGMYQIVVQSFPNPNSGRWQITAQGGVEPKWRRDGRELYYLGLDGKLFAVPVKTEPAFEAGTPLELFETPLTVNRPSPSRDRRYDVAPDGRFLIAVPIVTQTPSPAVAIVNWASGLKPK